MTAEMVHLPRRKFRKAIPEVHRQSMDTMIHWLWHQRFGTVQTIWQESQKQGRLLDHTACALVLQAIMGKDLESINQVFQRIEGGTLADVDLQNQEPGSIRF